MTICSKPRSGKIEIDLTGPQGNAFCLLGYARKFAKQLGQSEEQIDELLDEMRQSDYEHLVKVFDREFGEFCILYR